MKFLLLPLCLVLTGCKVIDVSWNRLRIGYLDDQKESANGSSVTCESTYGLYLKWAPDVDWAAVWNDWNNEE